MQSKVFVIWFMSTSLPGLLSYTPQVLQCVYVDDLPFPECSVLPPAPCRCTCRSFHPKSFLSTPQLFNCSLFIVQVSVWDHCFQEASPIPAAWEQHTSYVPTWHLGLTSMFTGRAKGQGLYCTLAFSLVLWCLAGTEVSTKLDNCTKVHGRISSYPWIAYSYNPSRISLLY